MSLFGFISDVIIGFISSYGLLGVLILMILESALLPFPSEVIMPFSGFVAYNKNEGIYGLLLYSTAGVIGNLIGACISYLIGMLVKREVLDKYLKYLFIKRSHLDKAEHWFKKNGYLAVFLGRMMPAIRTVISLPAGIFKLNIPAFLILTIIGSFPWNFGLAYMGYLLGEKWSVILDYSPYIDVVIVIAVVLFLLNFFEILTTKKLAKIIPIHK
ncbi:MAG TPA: DedA family protein [Geobacterales bacterium]|nr:DedA family protein [Geobacterales bacterium]